LEILVAQLVVIEILVFSLLNQFICQPGNFRRSANVAFGR
jgi:hypothetical protein